MIIPVPDDWKHVQGLIDAGNSFIASMEAMSKADLSVRQQGFDRLCKTQSTE